MSASLPFLNASCEKLRRFAALALILLSVASGARAADEPSTPVDSAPASVDSLNKGPAGADSQELGFGEMTPERRARAIEYSDIRNRFFFINTAWAFVVLLLVLFTGASAKLRAWAERIASKPVGTWYLYFLFLSLILFLADLPFDVYTGFVLEHRYGHSNQSFGQWFGDVAKSEAISYVLGGGVAFLVYVAIRRMGQRWWLWVGGFTAPVVAFFIVIAPVVISPLFNKFSPLADVALRDRILALASDAGISDSRVFEVDASRQSNKYNAYVTGLFGSKRIVLYDTILKDMEDDEILFIMAHEIGHYTMHHMWIGVAGITAFILCAAWLIHQMVGGLFRRYGARWGVSTLGDFASFPLLAFLLLLFSFLFMPVSNAVSRHFEHKADEYGLALTGNRAAAAKAFEKLAARNLSNPDPSPFIEFWLYDHPTIKDRVAYVLGQPES